MQWTLWTLQFLLTAISRPILEALSEGWGSQQFWDEAEETGMHPYTLLLLNTEIIPFTLKIERSPSILF